MAERVRNGWYWSGDLGYLDDARFLYFAGRRGDWIRPSMIWEPREPRGSSGCRAACPPPDPNKVLKRDLQAQRRHTEEPVYRWAGRGRPLYRRMTDADRQALDAEFATHGRKVHA